MRYAMDGVVVKAPVTREVYFWCFLLFECHEFSISGCSNFLGHRKGWLTWAVDARYF